MSRAAAASLLSAALLTWSATAAADPRAPVAPGWAFDSPAGEAVLAAGSAASLAAYFLPQRSTGWAPYQERALDPTLDWISDFTGAGAGSLLLTTQVYLLEGAYLANAGVPMPFGRALRTSIIDLEAVALSTGISFAVKRLTGRCRPRDFRAGRCEGDRVVPDAFPSGHTTPVAAIAGVHLSLASRTQGDASFRLGALSIAEAATLITMALRVGAGAHSWEDVGAGFIVGHVTGFALAAAHPMEELETPGELGAPAPGASVISWAGTF